MFTTKNMPGRFGNKFFRNLAISEICKKYDFKVEYDDEDKFIRLGIELFHGTRQFNNYTLLNDKNFFYFITTPHKMDTSFKFIGPTYCQTKDFALYLQKMFSDPTVRSNVINNNPYKHQYNSNNDLFIHIRLDDAKQWQHSIKYFETAISKCKFTKGYISSDSPNSEIVQTLIKKYDLNLYHSNEIDTFQFASTCKYLILSSGTFSWIIGFLGFYSTVFYPNHSLKTIWHGDIYVFPEWNMIDYSD